MLARGWVVEYFDDTTVNEDQIEWKFVKKHQIKTLKLWFDGRCWVLTGKEGYLQKKQASMIPGVQESFQVESRSIGYYEGGSKVWYTVNETNGVMKMHIEE